MERPKNSWKNEFLPGGKLKRMFQIHGGDLFNLSYHAEVIETVQIFKPSQLSDPSVEKATIYLATK